MKKIKVFYSELEQILEKLSNRKITTIVGDFNAKIGVTKEDRNLRETVGLYGLGERNVRGERLLHFCIDNNIFITNAGFLHHPRRLYTWMSPGDRYRNQTGYILVKSCWRTIFKDVKTYPEKDCNSDHQLLLAELRIKLRKNNK
ncbi:hypothetical protein ILUMI_08957 [Ignelater luminosus]|uniref:Endonuclease/exonuclease/phosphatase domain-containing protein n=1 Tax=Ignelater luminosus TaxID=2038154 RepID=A0A8K0D0Q8_IGNLU|nr:hypothetical protein ILUMI_08957 [Ignelater luminosus]